MRISITPALLDLSLIVISDNPFEKVTSFTRKYPPCPRLIEFVTPSVSVTGVILSPPKFASASTTPYGIICGAAITLILGVVNPAVNKKDNTKENCLLMLIISPPVNYYRFYTK